MKSMKKLIPAIAMLIISAVLLSTASYAWFSMNTTVTATGMQVTAKSNSFFLQIVNSGGTFSNTESQNSATATTASKDVFPVTVGSAVVVDGAVTDLLGTETETTALKWATAYSNDPTSSAKSGNYTDVSTLANATDGNVYTLINTFKVRLNPDAGTGTATNLTVSNTSISAADGAKNSMLAAVRVLVMAGDGVTVFDSTGAFVEGNSYGIIQSSVTSAESTVTVYVFFDGDYESVITNNILSSAGYNVSFDLTVTPGT